MLQPKQKVVFVCDVCGYEQELFYGNAFANAPCNIAQEPEVAGIKVGDEVWLYLYIPTYPGMGDMRKPLERSPYSIRGIRYSQPDEHLYSGWATASHGDKLPIHTLIVLLAQSRYPNGEPKAWKPDDTSSYSLSITYQDLVLWQEGDRTKLEAAGMLMLPKPSWFQKLKRLLGP